MRDEVSIEVQQLRARVSALELENRRVASAAVEVGQRYQALREALKVVQGQFGALQKSLETMGISRCVEPRFGVEKEND